MARVAARVVEARAHGLAHAGSPESAYVSRGAAMARSSQRMCNLGSCWANLDPATALFARSLFGGGWCGRSWCERGWRGRSRRAARHAEAPARGSARHAEAPVRGIGRRAEAPARGIGRRAGGVGVQGQVDERAQTAILGPQKATKRPSRHVLLGGTAAARGRGRARDILLSRITLIRRRDTHVRSD